MALRSVKITGRFRVFVAFIGVAFVASLVWFSAYLAANRIYQVDECQNLFMAKSLASGNSAEFFTNASLFLLGPISWLAQAFERSEDYFAAARLLFLALFWFNLLLMARIAGGSIFTVKGLFALLGAATLSPLWDYGFEIRHDNLVLTGMLLIWWAIRAKPMGIISYMLAGAFATVSLFVAVKAVVYVLPLSAMVLIIPPPQHHQPRWRLMLAWIGGAIVAAGIVRLCYGMDGKWELYCSVFHGVAKYSAGGGGGSPRFWPWFTLSRLLSQSPVLLLVAMAAFIALVVEVRRIKSVNSLWEGNLPEACLVCIALVGLFANPSPFPYNVLHIVPYLFLLSFRYAAALWQEMPRRESLLPILVILVISAHLTPFAFRLVTHTDFSNRRQKVLMGLAEAMTASKTDPVYDAIGMVPTRSSIHFMWYLHSLNMRNFLEGPGPRVRDMLAARPAAVFIPSYRTDWLSTEDHEFIQKRYVPLADDFWVLGKVLKPGGGGFDIFHSGRYRVASAELSNIATISQSCPGTNQLTNPRAYFAAELDGVSVTNEIVELSVGQHQILTADNSTPAVVWIGPLREALPRLSVGDHQKLFVNWY